MKDVEHGSKGSKTKPINDHIIQEQVIPDGGYGWVITFASFMCHFIADGMAYTFGVIYPDLLNAFGTSKSTTSWIGSLFVGIPLLSGPIAGVFLERYGCRTTTVVGGVICSLGMLLSSFANSVEMLAVTYGVISGFGLALVYLPASVIPSFWFEKRRALATGIAVAGSGLGTFAMAPLTEYLLDEYGWRGTLLVMSAVTLNFIVFAALFQEVPFSSVAPKVSFAFADKQSLSSAESKSDETLYNPALCQSFKSLNVGESVQVAEIYEGKVTPNYLFPNNNLRKHHSTNTMHTGEEFESLYVCDDQTHKSAVKQPTNGVTSQPSRLISIGHLMLRSRHSLLFVSRPDLTLAMNSAATRRRTTSSCPELSVASDDYEEDQVEEDQVLRKTKVRNLFWKIRKIAVEMCDIRLLAVPVYLLFFISNFMLSYANDLPYIYLPDYTTSLSIDNSSFLISIIGIVSTFGQILFGYLGDKKCFDTLLLYGISMFICGVFVTTIPALKTYAALVAFSIVFGLFISANYSLETVVLIRILSLEQLTKAYGLLMFGQGVASLAGPPVAGLLWDISKEYVYTFIFAGVSIMISGILAMCIVCMQNATRSRSVSESTDTIIIPPAEC